MATITTHLGQLSSSRQRKRMASQHQQHQQHQQHHHQHQHQQQLSRRAAAARAGGGDEIRSALDIVSGYNQTHARTHNHAHGSNYDRSGGGEGGANYDRADGTPVETPVGTPVGTPVETPVETDTAFGAGTAFSADTVGTTSTGSTGGIDYEEMRRQQLLRGTRVAERDAAQVATTQVATQAGGAQGGSAQGGTSGDDGSAAAAAVRVAAHVVSPDGTGSEGGGAPSDERVASVNSNGGGGCGGGGGVGGNVGGSAGRPLPPRYGHHHISTSWQSNSTVDRGPADNGSKHQRAPSPLDTTEADFDRLKSRTLLTAFERMKRDERLAEIDGVIYGGSGGKSGGGRSNGRGRGRSKSESSGGRGFVPISPEAADDDDGRLHTGNNRGSGGDDGEGRGGSQAERDVRTRRQIVGITSALSDSTPRHDNLTPGRRSPTAAAAAAAATAVETPAAAAAASNNGVTRSSLDATDHAHNLDPTIIDGSPDTSGDYTTADVHDYADVGKSGRRVGNAALGDGDESNADTAAGGIGSGCTKATRTESRTRTERTYDGYTGAATSATTSRSVERIKTETTTTTKATTTTSGGASSRSIPTTSNGDVDSKLDIRLEAERRIRELKERRSRISSKRSVADHSTGSKSAGSSKSALPSVSETEAGVGGHARRGSIESKSRATTPRREKEPSPSPSGRYGAVSPPPVDAAATTAVDARPVQSKPMERMVSKYAAAAALSIGDHNNTAPATSILAAEEQQSMISTLGSIMTDEMTEDESGLDNDHYFRQDEGLNPPSVLRTTALSPDERMAFKKKAEEVKSAEKVRDVVSPTGDMFRETIPKSSSSDAFLETTASDAYVLAGAWSPGAHPSSNQSRERDTRDGHASSSTSKGADPSLSKRDPSGQILPNSLSNPPSPARKDTSTVSTAMTGNQEAESKSNVAPHSPSTPSSPLREFMKLRKQLAERSDGKQSTKTANPAPDAPGSRMDDNGAVVQPTTDEVIVNTISPSPSLFSVDTEEVSTSGRSPSITDDVLDEGPQPYTSHRQKYRTTPAAHRAVPHVSLNTIEEIDRELDRRENLRRNRQSSVAAVQQTRISNAVGPSTLASQQLPPKSAGAAHSQQQRHVAKVDVSIATDFSPFDFDVSLLSDPESPERKLRTGDAVHKGEEEVIANTVGHAASNQDENARAEESDYVKQLRARLPQSPIRHDVTASANESGGRSRDMRKMSNRRSRSKSRTRVALGEQSEGLVEAVVSEEKVQVSQMKNGEGSDSSSVSSTSSTSQIAECVSDVSPPPLSKRDIRRRAKLRAKKEAEAKKTEPSPERRKVGEEEDTVFESVNSSQKLFPAEKDLINVLSASSIPSANAANDSLTAKDDELSEFFTTSSVPSVTPMPTYTFGEDSSTLSRTIDEPSTLAGSTLEAGTALTSLPEVSEYTGDSDSDSDSVSSSSTGATESVSDIGLNHGGRNVARQTKPIKHRNAPATRSKDRVSAVSKRNIPTVLSNDTEVRGGAHNRTRSAMTNVSSFSFGGMSTPSDERQAYRDDEIFSGAYRTDEDWQLSNNQSRAGKQPQLQPQPQRSQRPPLLPPKEANSDAGDLDILNAEAAEYVETGEYDLALQTFGKVLDVHSARYGESHPFVASTYHNMGIVHAKNAKNQANADAAAKSNNEALLCFQSAARIARDALGSDHPNVAVSLVRLGFILLGMGQHENALITFNEALRVRKASLGPDHALVSKIQNNIGVTTLQLKQLDKAREAFGAALEIQRKVLSRVVIDCNSGQVGEEFLQRAKLEVADTLCNIGSLNLRWVETERCPLQKEAALLKEATAAFTEAFEIRLAELGLMHPITKKTKDLLEKAQKAQAAAQSKVAAAPTTTKDKRTAPAPTKKRELTQNASADDDSNSITEMSAMTSEQVGCSPAEMLGLGAMYRYATDYIPSSNTLKEIENANENTDTPDCCAQIEDRTCVWVTPHCIPDFIPGDQQNADPLFAQDSVFRKEILRWPKTSEKNMDRFNCVIDPGEESAAESSITMEIRPMRRSKARVNSKPSIKYDDNDDEESVMISEFASPNKAADDDSDGLPAPDLGDEELPAADLFDNHASDESSPDPKRGPEKKKKKRKKRGLMLIRPMRRSKAIRKMSEGDTEERKAIKSILKKSSRKSAWDDIEDIDGGDKDDVLPGQNREVKALRDQPSKKDVARMLKNPEKNLNGLYTAAAGHLERQEYEQAEALFKTMIASHKRQHGNVHKLVGSALHNLGIVYLKAERHEEALATFDEAVQVRKQLALNDKQENPDVAVSLVKMGITNLLLRRFEGALESFRAALAVRRRVLGELHPSTARVYNNIGCVHVEFNQLHEARGAFEAALQVQRHALSSDPDNGPLRFGASTTLCNLGYLHKNLGQQHMAAAALREALELQESVLGRHHPTVLATLDSLAEANARNNNCIESIRCYNSILIRFGSRDKGGQMTSEQRRASAITLFKISRVHLKQKDYDAALRKLKEALFYARGLGDPRLEAKFQTEMENVERAQKDGKMDWV